jgi:hypothetical protein
MADFNRVLKPYWRITGRRWCNAGGSCERSSDEIRHSSPLKLTETVSYGDKR